MWKLEFRIRNAAFDALVAHAREAAPAECCGILLGRAGEIVEAVRARNIAEQSSTRFEIDPRDHINVRRDARRRGLDVVGFYHSHPCSAAEPSETDRAEAGYDDHLYVIVSLASDPPAVSAYALEHGNFRALPFVTVR
jgi:proteasome lid subunit RPN8/RPN11